MECQIGGYERNVRQRCNGIEAVELTWSPGARTPKHSHRAHGWTWVLKGRLFEVRDGIKIYHEEGASFRERPDGTTHIVGNDSVVPAISFHVYRPELEMDFFIDDESDRIALFGAVSDASR